MATYVIRYNDLGSAPSEQGLYGWFLSLEDGTDVLHHHRIVRKRSFGIRARGPLRERYEGGMVIQDILPPAGLRSADLAEAVLAFSPPVYIGMSKNINARLSQHKSKLEEIVYGGSLSDLALSTAEPDSDEESAVFASRFGSYIRSNRINLKSLYVKAVTTPELSRLAIRNAETYLNSTFSPPYGVR